MASSSTSSSGQQLCDPNHPSGGAPLMGSTVFSLQDTTSQAWIGYNGSNEQSLNNLVVADSFGDRAFFWVAIPADQYVQVGQQYPLTTLKSTQCCPDSSNANLGVSSWNICTVYDPNNGCSPCTDSYGNPTCATSTFSFKQDNPLIISGQVVVDTAEPVTLIVTSNAFDSSNGTSYCVGTNSDGIWTTISDPSDGGCGVYNIYGAFAPVCSSTESCCSITQTCIPQGASCTTPPADSKYTTHELAIAIVFVIIALIAMSVAAIFWYK